jgi:hypothetical protein
MIQIPVVAKDLAMIPMIQIPVVAKDLAMIPMIQIPVVAKDLVAMIPMIHLEEKVPD